LNCTGALGKRVLDISLQAWHDNIPSGTEEIPAASEILRTITIETQEPIHYDVFVTYSQSKQGLPSFPRLVDLDEPDLHSCEATVGLIIECTADCNLEIAEMKLTKTVCIILFTHRNSYTSLEHSQCLITVFIVARRASSRSRYAKDLIVSFSPSFS
jgi:hypothetical protein